MALGIEPRKNNLKVRVRGIITWNVFCAVPSIESGGATGVPLIDVEGILIRGYNPEAIRAAIEKRKGP